MQEEVDSRTVALVINSAKLTGRVMMSAISRFLAHHNAKKQQKAEVIPHGKQSVKQLIGQNQGVTSIESNDPDIKAFEKVARKYGVDYAIKKVPGDPPKHLIFFKARDQDALDAAFGEFLHQKQVKEERPSIRKLLKNIMDRMPKRDPTKVKDREQTL